MDYETIILDKKERIATITLNRPERLNAITNKMEEEFIDAIRDVTLDNEVRVVVITGAGRGFCAGEDLTQRPGETPGPRRQSLHIASGGPNRSNMMVAELRSMPKPVVAAVNGAAVGQGLGICIHSDIRIASENARLGAVWMLRGIPPESLGAFVLPQIVGIPKAIELIFTGRIIDAQEAKEIGLVSEVHPADKFAEATHQLATSLAKAAPVALALAKRAIYQSADSNLGAASQLERFSLDYAGKTEDREEGIRSFLEKREADFKGR